MQLSLKRTVAVKPPIHDTIFLNISLTLFTEVSMLALILSVFITESSVTTAWNTHQVTTDQYYRQLHDGRQRKRVQPLNSFSRWLHVLNCMQWFLYELLSYSCSRHGQWCRQFDIYILSETMKTWQHQKQLTYIYILYIYIIKTKSLNCFYKQVGSWLNFISVTR